MTTVDKSSQRERKHAWREEEILVQKMTVNPLPNHPVLRKDKRFQVGRACRVLDNGDKKI